MATKDDPEANDHDVPEKATAADAESSEGQKVEQGLATFREVFSFGAGPKKRFCLCFGMLAATVAGCVFPAMAFYFAKSFEELGAVASSDGFMDSIRDLAFAFMILGLIAFGSMSAYATLLETAAEEMTISLKTEWFNALLRQDLAYFDIKDVSGTASIISTNGVKYKKGLGRKLGEGTQFLITFCGGMGYAFWASWRTSLIVLTCLPVMALSVWFLLKMNQSQSARSNASYAEAGSIVYMTVAAIRTILSLNAVQTMIDKFTTATERAYKVACSQIHWIGLANGSMMGSFLLSYIAVTLYGSFLLYDQVRDNGCDPSGTTGNSKCDPAAVDVFGSLMGITFAAAVLPQVSACIEAFTGARAACFLATVAMNRKLGTEGNDDEAMRQSRRASRRGSTIALPKYAIDSSSPDGLRPNSVEGHIEFRDVTFSYPTRKEVNVFDGFSLEVAAGSTVALVGPSGSGKSTSVQLLERFYDPKMGSITLDGVDLRLINVKWLRQRIGLVSQEPKLFACSIKENIAYGLPGATMEQIEEAAKMANAHDFIKTFPDGYDTQVGDLGGKLSGGQKQRIAIARVLVKNPKIILLDEATSALDSESEGVVQQALDRLMEDGSRTIIVIAHRLSTIRNADLIAVVNEGQVVETGMHGELIDAKGRYYDLVEAQKAPLAAPTPTERSNSDTAPSSRRSSEADLEALDRSNAVPLLRLGDVHFSYPSRPDNKVFRGLNLSVYPGETLALVGPSGGGKSTTVQLIERFYDPDEGTVELDGEDLKSLNVKWLRAQIGLVSQEPTLFDTSIAENIRFGYDGATQEEIEEAAREANAHEFILSFPDGYDTQVGEGGTQVSGGQKQRLALARVLLKKPRILLLDEATSALDTASERIVQEALDKVMASKSRTTIVIAHRLSTIRNADRIAVIASGKVREMGTHDELMALPNGRYRRLQAFQNLEREAPAEEDTKVMKKTSLKESIEKLKEAERPEEQLDEVADAEDIDKKRVKSDAQRARILAKDDKLYFLIGTIGAVLAGLVFPAWGFIFAYMIEVLYTPVFECTVPPSPFSSCQESWDFEAGEMKALAGKVAWGCFGTICATLIGNMLLFYGFGTASEKMNKRVRDLAFVALVRQEVTYFDLRPVGTITSQIQEDTALIHSFSGEPIRTLVMSLASVLVGLIVSFVFMWPFALLTLGILPFMAFGAETEMRMYVGEDEGDASVEDEHSPGGIVVETLVNIRTVASLTIEEARSAEFAAALRAQNPTPYRTNFVKGMTAGLGQFIQFWGIALMFWWGGWLLFNYPNAFEYRDFLISMFALLFSLSGLGIAAQGATNREKAKIAANRIFDLSDRESSIDPLSEEGKKDI